MVLPDIGQDQKVRDQFFLIDGFQLEAGRFDHSQGIIRGL